MGSRVAPSVALPRGASVVELVAAPGDAAQGWALGAALRREARLALVALGLALLAGPLAVACEAVAGAAQVRLAPNATLHPCSRFILDDRAVTLMVNVSITVYLSELGFLIASVHANRRVIKFAPHMVVASGVATIGAIFVFAKSYDSAWRGLAVVEFVMIGAMVIYSCPHITFFIARLVASRGRRWARELGGLVRGILLSVFGVVLGATALFYSLLSNSVSGSTSLIINGEHPAQPSTARPGPARPGPGRLVLLFGRVHIADALFSRSHSPRPRLPASCDRVPARAILGDEEQHAVRQLRFRRRDCAPHRCRDQRAAVLHPDHDG
jgi:hypothetical protein